MDGLKLLRETPLPFAAMLGLRFLEASADKVTAELVVRDELCTRPAVLHGGAIMAFADTLGAAGTILNLDPGFSTTTVESKTNFLASAPLGARVVGEATPVHRGRRLMVWQTRMTIDGGRLVALTTQTQMVIEARPG